MICGNLRRFVSAPSQEFPRRQLPFRDGSGGFSLTLKRNCSISPAGLLAVFAALSGAGLVVGIGFAIAGAWPILPFVGLEIVAFGMAFVMHARRAGDYERIELSEEDTLEIGRHLDPESRLALAAELSRRLRVIAEK